MIRDFLGDKEFWDKWVSYSIDRIPSMQQQSKLPSADLSYRPQYLFELTKECFELIFRQYSRGDDIKTLSIYFLPLLKAWEESERLGKEVWTENQQYTRHAWQVNLDHYIVCFWLVGLALLLEIPDEQWQRLLLLIGNEGEDELLDTVIATRQVNRKIGQHLCHPKPYKRLLTVIKASPENRPQLLKVFVEHWYKELDRPPKKGMPDISAMYERPYWYNYHKNLAGGAYFGHWCIEAAVVAKVFDVDDSLCCGHRNYPQDLVKVEAATSNRKHSNVTSEHVDIELKKTKKINWFDRLIGKKK